MVRVRVAGVALDAAQQHVILLTPIEGAGADTRMLPVWIGAQEATSILVAVQGVTPPRPLAHDLMTRLLDALGATVERVEITRLEEGTFYAEVAIATAHGERTIDARPSDAIALASRTGAPIAVADDVFAEAGVDDIVTAEADEEGSDEEKVDEFRRFLDDVDPEDFQG
jgi:uncharacterized protein